MDSGSHLPPPDAGREIHQHTPDYQEDQAGIRTEADRTGAFLGRAEFFGESIPDNVRNALRDRHEVRRSEAIRQFEEQQAAAAAASSPAKKEQPSPDGENTPARKHRFSHEGGIKKSLMANMETPVNTDAEESHRQYGARAEAVASATAQPQEKKSKDKKSDKNDEKTAKKAAKKAAEKAAQKKAESKKNEKKSKDKDKEKGKEKDKKPGSEKPPEQIHPPTAASAFADVDEDSLIEMPKQNLPGLKLDPSAYSSMNLSEILFGEGKGKDAKKKKKK